MIQTFHKSLSGLYAITDSDLIVEEKLIDIVEQAIVGGARIIQYRDKSQNATKRLEQAQNLKMLCRRYAIPLIINDDITLAQVVGADGVHLGKEDGSIATARRLLGNEAIIGISCYNQLVLAQQAIAAGATYIAFGRFFDSTTKPDAVLASVELLRTARQLTDKPIVAIGGITAENGKVLITAGADCLAVIGGLFGQRDVKIAARQFSQLFSKSDELGIE